MIVGRKWEIEEICTDPTAIAVDQFLRLRLLVGGDPLDESVAQPLQQSFHVPHAFPEFADMGIDSSHVAAHVPYILPRLPPQALDFVPRLLPQAPHFATQPSHAGQRQSAKTDAHCRHCHQYPDQINIHGLGLHLMARDGIRLHLAIKGFRAIGSILPLPVIDCQRSLPTMTTAEKVRSVIGNLHRKGHRRGQSCPPFRGGTEEWAVGNRPSGRWAVGNRPSGESGGQKPPLQRCSIRTAPQSRPRERTLNGTDLQLLGSGSSE